MTTTQTMDSTAALAERDHVRGSRRARVTLIEYGDFDCPHSGNPFDAHLHAPAVLERVRRHQQRGLRSGVVGTPSFFINGQHYEGQVDYEPMRAAIDSVLEALPRPAKKPIRRRDATGHLVPRYQALLLKQSGRSGDAGQGRAPEASPSAQPASPRPWR